MSNETTAAKTGRDLAIKEIFEEEAKPLEMGTFPIILKFKQYNWS